MAAGDKYLICDGKTLEQVLRQLFYVDADGNPVLHNDPNGTALQPFFNCANNRQLTLEQVLRDTILQDAGGDPYLNTTA